MWANAGDLLSENYTHVITEGSITTMLKQKAKELIGGGEA